MANRTLPTEWICWNHCLGCSTTVLYFVIKLLAHSGQKRGYIIIVYNPFSYMTLRRKKISHVSAGWFLSVHCKVWIDCKISIDFVLSDSPKGSPPNKPNTISNCIPSGNHSLLTKLFCSLCSANSKVFPFTFLNPCPASRSARPPYNLSVVLLNNLWEFIRWHIACIPLTAAWSAYIGSGRVTPR